MVSVTESAVRCGVAITQTLLNITVIYGVVDPFEVECKFVRVGDAEVGHRNSELHFVAFESVWNISLFRPVPVSGAALQLGCFFAIDRVVDHEVEALPLLGRLFPLHRDKQPHPFFVFIGRDGVCRFDIEVDMGSVVRYAGFENVVSAGCIGESSDPAVSEMASSCDVALIIGK